MPYVYDRTCFICGRVNRDREDFITMLQMCGPRGETIDVCCHHAGVITEHEHQKLHPSFYAGKRMSHPSFWYLLSSYYARIMEDLNMCEEG
jgi:hypothetical protein